MKSELSSRIFFLSHSSKREKKTLWARQRKGKKKKTDARVHRASVTTTQTVPGRSAVFFFFFFVSLRERKFTQTQGKRIQFRKKKKSAQLRASSFPHFLVYAPTPQHCVNGKCAVPPQNKKRVLVILRNTLGTKETKKYDAMCSLSIRPRFPPLSNQSFWVFWLIF